jgi:hypothetical protein
MTLEHSRWDPKSHLTEMRSELTEVNKDFVGENSVFPVKNGAP